MTTLFTTSPDGTRIAYDVTGSGPFLVLLHGAGKTRRDWHKAGYVKRLRDDFAVIAMDIRGSGESDRLFEASDYDIESVCQDVIAVADACGAAQFAVWGFSLGGNIARYLAAWSERVTAAIIIGVPFGPAVHEDFDRTITELVQKWEPLVAAYNQGTLSEDVPQKERKPIASGLIPVLLAFLQAMRSWPSIEPADVDCPTPLLAGTKNKLVTKCMEGNQEPLRSAGVQVEAVKGLTHNQEFTKVDRVFPVVSSFLKSRISG
jgi:pimeloyl-ACP methyl ester carboxylesterase